VKRSDTPIVLFLDEIHTVLGAKGAGGDQTADLLKPALARGGLRVIGATTWREYKRDFEKDAALARRFEPIHVE
jgi:type VI secretion system protein VasG